MTKYDALVTYAPDDEPAAKLIGLALSKSGLSCGFNNAADSADPKQLLGSVRPSGQIFLLLSRATDVSRSHADWQVLSTFSRRRVIPVRLDEVDTVPLIGPRICIDLHNVPMVDWVDHLTTALAPPQRDQVEVFPGQRLSPRNLPALTRTIRAPFVWNAPIRRSLDFFGAEIFMVHLEHSVSKRISQSSASVSVILGPHGLGKSTLALEYAHRRRADFDVVWWCTATNSATMLADLKALASNLGLAGAEVDTLTAARAARNWFETVPDRWLLIFDNANDPDVVSPWMPVTGNGVIIITSRVNAWGSTTRYLPVDRLDTQAAAGQLLALTGWRDTAAATELATKVGGVPIALELAGALCSGTKRTLEDARRIVADAAETALANSGVIGPRQLENAILDRLVETGVQDAIAELPRIQQLLPTLSLLADTDLPVSILKRHLGFSGSKEVVGVLVSCGLARLTDAGTLTVDPTIHSRLLRRSGPPTAGSVSAASHIVRECLALTSSAEVSLSSRRVFVGKATSLIDVAQTASRVSEHVVLLAADIAQIFFEGGELQDAIHWLNRTLELIRLSHDDLTHVEIRIRSQLANIMAEAGRFKEARDQLSCIYQHEPDAANTNDFDNVVVNSNLALAFGRMGATAEARRMQESLLKSCLDRYGPESPAVLTLKNNLASTLWDLGELEAAECLFEDVYELRKSLYGSTYADTITSMANLASVKHELGHLDIARSYYERSIDAYRRALPPDHPELLACINNLALLYFDLGAPDKARDVYEDLVVRCRRSLGTEHPDTLSALSNLAIALAEGGDYIRGRELHEQVLRSRVEVLGDEHQDTLSSMASLCQMLSLAGDLVGAYAISGRVIRACVRVLGEQHPETIAAMRNRLPILEKLQKTDELAALQQTLDRVMSRKRTDE